MLQLAIEEASELKGQDAGAVSVDPRSSWRVCTLEIDRGGVSYTVDTLHQIQTELPEAKLYFLIGADAIRDVGQWKAPAEIFALATPLVVRRAGESQPDLSVVRALCDRHRLPQLIEMPTVDVSSSDIRSRVASAKPIDNLTPGAVVKYIYANRLYQKDVN
jgi:nicotinate-nucleotide adenylyltransferase